MKSLDLSKALIRLCSIIIVVTIFNCSSINKNDKQAYHFKTNVLYKSDLGLTMFANGDSIFGFSQFAITRGSCDYFFRGRLINDSTYKITINPDKTISEKLGFDVDQIGGYLYIQDSLKIEVELPSLPSGCGRSVPFDMKDKNFILTHFLFEGKQLNVGIGILADSIRINDTLLQPIDLGIFTILEETPNNFEIEYNKYSQTDEYNWSDSIKRVRVPKDRVLFLYKLGQEFKAI